MAIEDSTEKKLMYFGWNLKHYWLFISIIKLVCRTSLNSDWCLRKSDPRKPSLVPSGDTSWCSSDQNAPSPTWHCLASKKMVRQWVHIAKWHLPESLTHCYPGIKLYQTCSRVRRDYFGNNWLSPWFLWEYSCFAAKLMLKSVLRKMCWLLTSLLL